VYNLGAQIIDLMLLVVDITKGVQTQTAECLIIGEITCDKMVVVLNKVDLIEQAKRSSTIDRVSRCFWYSATITFMGNIRIESSNRHHLSCGDCLEDKSEDYQNCSVLYCIPQLYRITYEQFLLVH